MTVAEIIATAQNLAEEIYDDPTWIRFINMAIDDLTPVAKVIHRVVVPTLVVSAGAATVATTHTAIANTHEFVHVYVTPTTPVGTISQYRRLPLSDNISTGWKQTATDILVQNIPPVNTVPVTAATVTFDLYRRIPYVTALVDVPGFPEQYHNLLVAYVCARSQQREEELNDKNDFYAEYLLGKQDFAVERIWATEPQNRRHIRRMRVMGQVGAQRER